jgi:ribulose-5-phosphate 4-epimerase/fuculose-1-phosphate aldolase
MSSTPTSNEAHREVAPCGPQRPRKSLPPLESLLCLAHQAASAGLVIASCGNASVRVSPESFLVTASGVQLAELQREDLSEVSLDGHHSGGPRPSIESNMHRLAYLVRPETRAILHCHSKWATLMACLEEPILDLNFIIEVPAYIGKHSYVPYLLPGSDTLAQAVAKALEDPQVSVVQLTNHGQVATGSSWEEALQRLIYFERACWMALQPHRLKRISNH